MASRVKSQADKIRSNEASNRAPRRKAYKAARATDSALVDVGSGLVRFKSTESCRLLKEGESRYLTDRKRPCPFDVPEHVPQKRSCVINEATREKRHDLKLLPGAGDHSVRAFGHDEGPQDLLVFHWFPEAGFRSMHLMDPVRRCPRDMYLAANACDMWSMVLDTTGVLNYDHGPFLSLQHFAEQAEAVPLFSSLAESDDDLLGAGSSHGWGTALAHRRSALQELGAFNTC